MRQMRQRLEELHKGDSAIAPGHAKPRIYRQGMVEALNRLGESPEAAEPVSQIREYWALQGAVQVLELWSVTCPAQTNNFLLPALGGSAGPFDRLGSSLPSQAA
jgi:hypothetical protein